MTFLQAGKLTASLVVFSMMSSLSARAETMRFELAGVPMSYLARNALAVI